MIVAFASFNFLWTVCNICRWFWKWLLKSCTMKYSQKFSRIHCLNFHLIIVETLLFNHWFLMRDIKIKYVSKFYWH